MNNPKNAIRLDDPEYPNNSDLKKYMVFGQSDMVQFGNYIDIHYEEYPDPEERLGIELLFKEWFEERINKINQQP